MTATAPAKAPAQGDVRIAKQLLGFFPWIGQLWHAAVREGGGVYIRFPGSPPSILRGVTLS